VVRPDQLIGASFFELAHDRDVRRVVDRHGDERWDVSRKGLLVALRQVGGRLAPPCGDPERLHEGDEVGVAELGPEVATEPPLRGDLISGCRP